ncbi:hypothetical protein [Massilia horti]|uniref:Uncharacterized protein n=1 Tax=Massilia horti TaxID=2562153 RepID=A0A4Y9T031_9BURK|nr:hypothetical protein [Massilia horti]TFW32352.1 hypothetical protein E4O92_10320 [Massilia horti]
MGRAAVLLLGLALCGGAAAQDENMQQVQVDGIKNPEMKSYRAVWAGLDMFERQHELAPAAPQLRFRMRTNPAGGTCIGICESSRSLAVEEQDLSLRIAGNEASIAVPISPDGLFTVPRNRAAYNENADLILNRKKGTYKFSAEVRTPDLPENVRRLGDLRLECKVQMAIIKEELPFWAVAMLNSILLTTDWCMKGELKGNYIKFGFDSLMPIATATMTSGERSQKLEAKNRRFQVPLGDRSWPDDALIQLDYAQE